MSHSQWTTRARLRLLQWPSAPPLSVPKCHETWLYQHCEKNVDICIYFSGNNDPKCCLIQRTYMHRENTVINVEKNCTRHEMGKVSDILTLKVRRTRGALTTMDGNHAANSSRAVTLQKGMQLVAKEFHISMQTNITHVCASHRLRKSRDAPLSSRCYGMTKTWIMDPRMA